MNNIVEQLTETLGRLCGDCQQKIRSLVGQQPTNGSMRGPREAALFLLAERVANDHGMSRHEMKYGGKAPQVVQCRLEFICFAKKRGYSSEEIGKSLGQHKSTITSLLNRHESKDTGLKFPKPHRLRGKNWRPTDRDEEEKKRRGYTNERSIVRTDGSECLHGNDWRRRKQELRDRSGDQCEFKPFPSTELAVPGGERCRNAGRDAHHRVMRSDKRDDRLDNLADACGEHHELVDPRKLKWSKEKRP